MFPAALIAPEETNSETTYEEASSHQDHLYRSGLFNGYSYSLESTWSIPEEQQQQMTMTMMLDPNLPNQSPAFHTASSSSNVEICHSSSGEFPASLSMGNIGIPPGIAAYTNTINNAFSSHSKVYPSTSTLPNAPPSGFPFPLLQSHSVSRNPYNFHEAPNSTCFDPDFQNLLFMDNTQFVPFLAPNAESEVAHDIDILNTISSDFVHGLQFDEGGSFKREEDKITFDDPVCLDDSEKAWAYLKAVNPKDGKGKPCYMMVDKRQVIGESRDLCNVVLDSYSATTTTKMNAVHCVITLVESGTHHDNNCVKIVNCSHSNTGLYVNLKRLSYGVPQDLIDGDLIVFGSPVKEERRPQASSSSAYKFHRIR